MKVGKLLCKNKNFLIILMSVSILFILLLLCCILIKSNDHTPDNDSETRNNWYVNYYRFSVTKHIKQ